MTWDDLQENVGAAKVFDIGTVGLAETNTCIRLVRRLLRLLQKGTNLQRRFRQQDARNRRFGCNGMLTGV